MRLNFRQTMKAIGFTQKKFGEVIDVKGKTIVKYLDNPKELRIKHLEALAENNLCKQNNFLFVYLINLTL